MVAEFIQFGAFFLLWVAFVKIAAAYINDKSPGSALANGLAWFVPA